MPALLLAERKPKDGTAAKALEATAFQDLPVARLTCAPAAAARRLVQLREELKDGTFARGIERSRAPRLGASLETLDLRFAICVKHNPVDARGVPARCGTRELVCDAKRLLQTTQDRPIVTVDDADDGREGIRTPVQTHRIAPVAGDGLLAACCDPWGKVRAWTT